MKRFLALLALVALSACSGAGAVPKGALPPAGAASHGRAAADDAVGTPGEHAQGLPGEHAQGLPGEHAQGLPGANFACTGIPAAGSADCTIAINVNVTPNADPNLPAALIPGFAPADLQSAYALPATSAGGTVAIVDAYDDSTAEADLAVYRSAFGLPACTSQNGCFRKVNQRGQAGSYPAPDLGWSQEVALDLDMVSAACPRCSIVLVEADSALLDDLGAAVDTAAALGAHAISNSYYAIEWSNQSVEDAHYRHPGVAITASSGDRGYASYPASSPYVTSVSGTALTRGAGGWTESSWPYSGHGCSDFTPKPAWQRDATSCTKRSAVDVAAVADPQTGVATFATAAGGWVVAGGTSVGAPLVAAAYALSGHPDGPAYSYRHASGFHPIGGARYTLETGLGSPNGVAGL